MEVAVLTGGMANTSVVQKSNKCPRFGSSVLIALRLALALTFLGIAAELFREGANRSTWAALMLYFIAFIITDRVAFAIRLRILHRESDLDQPEEK